MNAESFKNPINELLGPASRRFGRALGAFAGILLRGADKYVLYDQMDEAILAKNMQEFNKALSEHDMEDIRPALPGIAVPVLERLSYVSSKELSDAFIKLLTKASTADGLQDAHPAFIHVIDRLSTDEAKILQHIVMHAYFLVLQIWFHSADQGRMILPSKTYLLLEDVERDLALDFPSNVHLYIDNLMSLGIIELANQNNINQRRIDLLKDMWARRINVPAEMFAGSQFIDSDKVVHTPYYSAVKLSSFGVKFATACLPDSKYLADLYGVNYGVRANGSEPNVSAD